VRSGRHRPCAARGSAAPAVPSARRTVNIYVERCARRSRRPMSGASKRMTPMRRVAKGRCAVHSAGWARAGRDTPSGSRARRGRSHTDLSDPAPGFRRTQE
jgi:hypothetical protein